MPKLVILLGQRLNSLESRRVLVSQLFEQHVQRIDTVGKRLDEHEDAESDVHVECTTIRSSMQ